MSNETKVAVEALICAQFVELLELARLYGITIKRMRELLPVTQLQALEQAGFNQGEMVAESGYTRKSIRKLLTTSLPADCINPIDRFIANWDADPQFPDVIEIDGHFPSFYHLHDKYGGEFTAPGLLKLLEERQLISVDGSQITLDPHRTVTAVPGPDRVQAAQCSLAALFGTLRHNLAGEGEPFTERRVWSPNIPEKHLSAFRREVAQANLEHRQRILEIMEKYQVSPDSPEHSDCLSAVGVGLYWYEKRRP